MQSNYDVIKAKYLYGYFRRLAQLGIILKEEKSVRKPKKVVNRITKRHRRSSGSVSN